MKKVPLAAMFGMKSAEDVRIVWNPRPDSGPRGSDGNVSRTVDLETR